LYIEKNKNVLHMREYIVEYLGTVFFLYVVIVTGNAFAIGAALAMAMYLGGPISGGHFNPLITILMVLSGKQPIQVLAPYLIAQLLGAFTVFQLYKRLQK
jgi:glycerol uptake facilitator-like aquaporin